jgi:hypothetical protein
MGADRMAVEQPVPLLQAATSAGIPARTLRNWIRTGKLAATRGHRGYLVRLGDVRSAAEIAGRMAASAEGSAQSAAAGLLVRDNERRAVELIQAAMLPLVDEIVELRAELERERRQREEAERERDSLREAVRARRPWWRR